MPYTAHGWADNDASKPLSAARVSEMDNAVQTVTTLAEAHASRHLPSGADAVDWTGAIHMRGTHAARPAAAASNAGLLYLETDTAGGSLFRSTGSAWEQTSAGVDPSVSGDLSGTLANAQIASGVIINSDVSASAAIAYSKLALAASIVNADVATSAAIAYSKLNLATSIVTGDIAGSLKPSGTAAAGTEALRALGTTSSTAAAGNDSRLSDQRTPTDASVTPAKLTGTSGERAVTLGLAGTIPASGTDTSDFFVPLPFNMTLLRMKATCKTAPTGAMVVQLRRSTNNTTPSWSDVTGFSVTFTSSQNTAVADPSDVSVNEGDLLGFSVSTGSGTNIIVEAIGTVR